MALLCLACMYIHVDIHNYTSFTEQVLQLISIALSKPRPSSSVRRGVAACAAHAQLIGRTCARANTQM